MINEIRKGMAVKRFHTSTRLQEETVGHHSANVCAIILRLNPKCSKNLLVRALMHDVPEAYTGDTPATFKWDNPSAKVAIESGERLYINNTGIPNPPISPADTILLKTADMVDLVLSCVEESNRGNKYAIEIARNGIQYLKDMPFYRSYKDQIKAMIKEVQHATNEGKR